MVRMPLDNTFWAERYGEMVDPFGHHWSLSQQIKMSPKEMEEKQKAAMAMFAHEEHPADQRTAERRWLNIIDNTSHE